jgi:hypothetical protein
VLPAMLPSASDCGACRRALSVDDVAQDRMRA